MMWHVAAGIWMLSTAVVLWQCHHAPMRRSIHKRDEVRR